MPEVEFTKRFVPFGEANEIELTPTLVSTLLSVKTKSGKTASPTDVRRFIELCAAQGLNPFANDAYLTGYDLDGGGTQFSLITSVQALMKRAEMSKEFDGIESGVMVTSETDVTKINAKTTELREGDFVYEGELLLGAWARVWRKDRRLPFSDRLRLSVFTTEKSRWAKDPAGMIVKCAEASALRKAFPSTLAGLYCREEMDALRDSNVSHLTDGRPEQDATRIVIPTEIVESEKVPVDRRTEDNQEHRREEPVREIQPESVWPQPIENLLGAAKRAKSEMALLSVKQGWLSIKGDYPADMVAEVEKFFQRRQTEVTPAGEKPKS